MSARHKRRVKVSLTPLGYIALFFVILIAVVVAFVCVISHFFSGFFADDSANSGAADGTASATDTTAPVIEQIENISVYEDAIVPGAVDTET